MHPPGYQKAKPEDIAQICRNGHLIVGSLKRFPDLQKVFCEECGTRTIDDCQHCCWPIAGSTPYGLAAGPYKIPKFCGECGHPFPWTETALAAAKDYADELEMLSAEDRNSLKSTFDDLAVETPRTPAAIERAKKFFVKIGPAAGDVLKSLVTTLATEAAKKNLGL